jgi:hypothetical protein
LLARWTATVSGTVSHAANGKTIRRNWLELAETSPPLAFKTAVETGLVSRQRNPVMKTKYTMFRRGEMFYMQDSATGKQTSLRTKDETEAVSLLEARNAAQRQPVLNLHLARAYLTASDPAFVERTWSVVMEQMQSRGKESSRERYASVFKSPSFDGIRNKKLMQTTADDFFAVFKQNQVSINEFLKRLHNFAVHLGWIAIPIVAPYLWPKYEPKDRRGITQAEHESVLEKEKKAEWKLYLELLWETGAAQSDAVS